MDAANPAAARVRAAVARAAERDPTLDAGRGIGIALVVYGHTLEVLFFRSDSLFITTAFEQWRDIYSFHMPLFFLISGAAHRVSDSKRSTRGRKATPLDAVIASSKLVALAWAIHIVASVLNLAHEVRAGGSPSLPGFAKSTVLALLTGADLHPSVVWFLIALAVVQLLVFAWTHIPSRPVKLAVAAACAASFAAGSDLGARIPNWYSFKAWPAA